MNDFLLLQSVDDELRSIIAPSVRAQFAGRVQQFYDPQQKRPALMRQDVDTGKAARFTVDTVHYDVQIAHRMVGGQPIKGAMRWGSRQEVAFNLRWSMMVATRLPDIMPSFLLAFSAMTELAINEFSTDTLAVLKREFLFIPDQKTAYDPTLQCFSVDYQMLNVSEDVFKSLISNQLL